MAINPVVIAVVFDYKNHEEYVSLYNIVWLQTTEMFSGLLLAYLPYISVTVTIIFVCFRLCHPIPNDSVVNLMQKIDFSQALTQYYPCSQKESLRGWTVVEAI